MLISHKHKFITIDIPKTGSRSLRESLYPMGIIDVVGEPCSNEVFYQHGTALDCARGFKVIDCNFQDYYSFCVVRNPWNRYFSFFKYFKSYAEKYMRRDESINWHEPEINQGKLCVELFTNKDNQTVLKNIILNNDSQDSYYCNENGEIIVNHIAEFENLQNEFVFLCNQVGIQTPSLQHGNKSSNSFNMHDIYNQELIDLVAKKEKNVIELKGYEY
jgi:hypothetical protein